MVDHHSLTLQITMASPLMAHLMALPSILEELLIKMQIKTLLLYFGHVANIFDFNPTSTRYITTKLKQT